MESKEILEGNKLIAEWLELKKHDSLDWYLIPTGFISLQTNNWSELYFHKSLDWLYPVICKIESTGHCSVDIIGKSCRVEMIPHHIEIIDNVETKRHSRFSNYCEGTTKIEAVYNSVIEFIKWHNQLPTPPKD